MILTNPLPRINHSKPVLSSPWLAMYLMSFAQINLDSLRRHTMDIYLTDYFSFHSRSDFAFRYQFEEEEEKAEKMAATSARVFQVKRSI